MCVRERAREREIEIEIERERERERERKRETAREKARQREMGGKGQIMRNDEEAMWINRIKKRGGGRICG